jgi:hypothetical protein
LKYETLSSRSPAPGALPGSEPSTGPVGGEDGFTATHEVLA